MGSLITGGIYGDNTGETYVKCLWFESISSGTSGTLTLPTQGTVVLDQWSAGVDALASQISSGIPTFVSPATAGGVTITATLNSSAAWTVSGTPSAYPIAIIYVYQVKLRYLDYTKTLGSYELIPTAVGVSVDVTSFAGNLTSAENTVQKALDKIDDLPIAHDKQHVITATADHTSTATSGKMLKADANGLPIDASNTDTEVASAVSLKHAAITLDTNADTILSLSTQALGLDTQAANLALMGPTSGAAAVPAFRSLVAADVNFKKSYHGIEAIGVITFADDTHILSIASITYWFNGVKYVTASPVTGDIDTLSTLTTNNTYFFYFDDALGALKAGTTATNFLTQVPVATVFWNGTNGAIGFEAHSHTRDLNWHKWSHDTIGTRYRAGLDLTQPTTVVDNGLSITGGTVQDEDIEHTVTNPQTTCRIIYKASATPAISYTWVNSALPYAGSGTQPQFLNLANYTLTNVGATDFACMWVFATTDQDRPIYIIPTHKSTTAHNTVALARAETAPVLADLNLSPEFKLIYRFIYKGNGDFQESNDYRLTQPLPSGGIPSTTAAAVSFSPAGTVAATSVQTAIEELDTEKLALSGGTMTGSIDMSGTQQITSLAVPDANGEAIRATTKITEVNLESATDLKHAAVTVSAPLVLTGQGIELKNNAGSPAQVTAIDIGALANSDTVIPTSKAVTTAIAAGGGITQAEVIMWAIVFS
jgi:hypothetical protein